MEHPTCRLCFLGVHTCMKKTVCTLRKYMAHRIFEFHGLRLPLKSIAQLVYKVDLP